MFIPERFDWVMRGGGQCFEWGSPEFLRALIDFRGVIQRGTNGSPVVRTLTVLAMESPNFVSTNHFVISLGIPEDTFFPAVRMVKDIINDPAYILYGQLVMQAKRYFGYRLVPANKYE